MIGERIAEIRKSKGLSQVELADKLNIHQSMVTRWEKGHIHPKPKTLQRIADALEVAPLELEAEQGPPESVLKGAKGRDMELARLLSQVHRLDDRDVEALKAVLEAMLTRSRVQEAILRP